jgi:hypothetical protein
MASTMVELDLEKVVSVYRRMVCSGGVSMLLPCVCVVICSKQRNQSTQAIANIRHSFAEAATNVEVCKCVEDDADSTVHQLVYLVILYCTTRQNTCSRTVWSFSHSTSDTCRWMEYVLVQQSHMY